MSGWQVRRVANWVNLTTPLGLLIAGIGGADVGRADRGMLLATGYGLDFPRSRAFTVGSVIVTKHEPAWFADQPRLFLHEERHATQWAWCLGLPFLPLYTLAMLWSQIKVADRAASNVFEQLAGLEDGGYVVPTKAEIAERKRSTTLVKRFLRG